MSGATVSVNPKLGDGTIVQIGGVGFDDFYQNLIGFVGAETADEIVKTVAARISPVSAGGQTVAAQPDQFQQAAAVVQQSFPQAQQVQPTGQPGPAPLCPNHQQPARWVPPGVSQGTGKPYSGFYSCAVSARGDRSCRIPR